MSENTLAPRSVSRPKADVYHFVFDVFGWATFTLIDELGEFSIQSDWGECAHRWPLAGFVEGETLTSFLANRAGVEYVLRKMRGGESSHLAPVFDFDATIARWHRIADDDNYSTLTADQVADLSDGLTRLEHTNSPDLLLERAPAELWAIEPELWDYLEYTPSPSFIVFRDELLPFFFDFLRGLEQCECLYGVWDAEGKG